MENDDKKKGEKPKERSLTLIDQIDDLKLPKRSINRRSIYMGENIHCWLKFSLGQLRADVIDLSSHGLALVADLRSSEKSIKTLKLGTKIAVEFNRDSTQKFTIEGDVSNISQVRFGDRAFNRIGIRILMRVCKGIEEFYQNIKRPYFNCRSYIRPQASCPDPLFYNEIIMFQVLAFTSEGMILVVSARCKTMLPHQRLELKVYVPGRGTYLVPVLNSDLYCESSDNRYRIYVTYPGASKEFLSAVSEYLTMFASGVTPNVLRKLGFTLGSFANAIEVNFQKSFTLEKKMSPSVLGLPSTEESSVPQYARVICCKLGPTIGAIFRLIFVEGKPERSRFAASGHKLPKEVMARQHVELVDFCTGEEMMLVDFLIPLLKHVIRISVQAEAEFLLLEASSPIHDVMQRLGFKSIDSEVKTNASGKSQTWSLMSLSLKKIVGNEGTMLPEKLWDNVYKDLAIFLKRRRA